MLRRITYVVVVCLILAAAGTGEWASAYTVDNIYVKSNFSGAFATAALREDSGSTEAVTPNPVSALEAESVAKADQPPSAGTSQARMLHDAKPEPVHKVKPIRKVKPYAFGRPCYADPRMYPQWGMFYQAQDTGIPMLRQKGWRLDAEALFARTRGKVRYLAGTYANYSYYGYYGSYGTSDYIDLNGDMGLPEHRVIGTYSVSYRFKPRWSMRYSFMPMESNSSGINGFGVNGNGFVFGTTLYSTGMNGQVKFEQRIQNLSLIYEPVVNPRVRVGLAGGFTRVDERLKAIQQNNYTSDTLNMDMNMGFAGVEIERFLKAGANSRIMSMVCKAGVSFGDDSFGSDLSTGVRCSLPMNNGRWGYLAGGYRFTTYKKKVSDFKEIDTSAEGGFVQMGLIF